jgi:hypothetical protein
MMDEADIAMGWVLLGNLRVGSGPRAQPLEAQLNFTVVQRDLSPGLCEIQFDFQKRFRE